MSNLIGCNECAVMARAAARVAGDITRERDQSKGKIESLERELDEWQRKALDVADHPVVKLLIAERDTLAASLKEADSGEDRAITERDSHEEWLNEIFAALGMSEEEATWSSTNDPREVAVDAVMRLVNENETLAAQVAEMRAEHERQLTDLDEGFLSTNAGHWSCTECGAEAPEMEQVDHAETCCSGRIRRVIALPATEAEKRYREMEESIFWHPIEDMHEDYGECLVCNMRDGGMAIAHVCDFDFAAIVKAEGWTHFRRIPLSAEVAQRLAAEHADRETGDGK